MHWGGGGEKQTNVMCICGGDDLLYLGLSYWKVKPVQLVGKPRIKFQKL